MSTPLPTPNASAPTTVPTPSKYEPKENGIATSVINKTESERANRGEVSVKGERLGRFYVLALDRHNPAQRFGDVVPATKQCLERQSR
jgi:hypothetical protein